MNMHWQTIRECAGSSVTGCRIPSESILKGSATSALQFPLTKPYRENHRMRSLLTLCRVVENEKGVTAIEYGLIAALIAIAAVVIMATLGTNLSTVFSEVAASL